MLNGINFSVLKKGGVFGARWSKYVLSMRLVQFEIIKPVFNYKIDSHFDELIMVNNRIRIEFISLILLFVYLKDIEIK